MPTMYWDEAHILDTVAAGLRDLARRHDLEQVVYSIDALDELGLHPHIQRSLRDAGYGVWPEQRYPADRTSQRKSEGKRCDVVLTPDGRELAELEAQPTLFDPVDAVGLQDAYWMEIKTVAQHTTDGPFPHYSRELLSPVTQDVRKMLLDLEIQHAGLLLVLFNETEEVGRHDLEVWSRRCLSKGLPVRPPLIQGFPLIDRLGNAYVTLGLINVRG